MRIEIEIPKEFEENFKHDRFEECLTRLNADAHMVAGNYEKETSIMLIGALKNSKPAYDADTVVNELGKASCVARPVGWSAKKNFLNLKRQSRS